MARAGPRGGGSNKAHGTQGHGVLTSCSAVDGLQGAMMLRVCTTFSTLAFAAAHGSLVHPRPRNSIDYLVNVCAPPFTGNPPYLSFCRLTDLHLVDATASR